MTQLLIFETHPVQYRAPVFRELQHLLPKSFEVIFASDFSVRGYLDREFGQTFAWNTPLLEGYPFRILGNDQTGGIHRWSGLSGKGIERLFVQTNPSAVLLHSFGYRFCWSAFWHAKLRGIPIWIRMETQDNAGKRGRIKGVIRSTVYRTVYKSVSLFFAIGQANRRHYLTHGTPESRIRDAHYCTVNSVITFTATEKSQKRLGMRSELGIQSEETLIGFFGKLIPKKDPFIILEAWRKLSCEQRSRTKIMFVGSGELEKQLRALADQHAIPAIFIGFVNQAELMPYYLATDILVLPSRRMGETWGLVVNEALDAGCSVAISDAVGCSMDFGDWERVRVFPEGNTRALTTAIAALREYHRDFSWATARMLNYSVGSAAASIAAEIALLKK